MVQIFFVLCIDCFMHVHFLYNKVFMRPFVRFDLIQCCTFINDECFLIVKHCARNGKRHERASTSEEIKRDRFSILHEIESLFNLCIQSEVPSTYW
jgi:hypothetical protein